MQHAGSLVAACGVQFLDQRLNPGPLNWEHSLSHWTTREVPLYLFKMLTGVKCFFPLVVDTFSAVFPLSDSVIPVELFSSLFFFMFSI